MRVAGVIEFGGPEAFQIVEVPSPEPGPGQVRIRVHAAAVNPTDTYMRNGAYRSMLGDRKPPYIPGMDAAGVIDAIGEGVTDRAVGDEVMAIVLPTGRRGGAYAEQIVVPSLSTAPIPKGASFVEASTLPMNGLTARLSLDLLALSPGQTLAVTGSAGAYGGYVIQLAKADGLRVIADASEADEDLVHGLGADVVVRRGADVAERFLAEAPGGVDAVADGSVQNDEVLAAIKDGGAFASIRPFDGTLVRDIVNHPVWVHTYAKEQAKLDRLREQVEEGTLTLRVAQALPAAEAGEAHRLLEAGGVRGRLVITF